MSAPEIGPGRGDVMTPSRFGPWRRERDSFVELFALTGIAIAQPALDIMSSDGGSVFVIHRATVAETVVFALFVVLAPVLAVWLIEVAAGLIVPRLRRWVHALLCGGIVGLITIEVLKHQTSLGTRWLIAGGVVAGAVSALVVLRVAVVRLFLRYLAFAPVAFVILFLFFSPVTTVVFRDEPTEAADVQIGRPDRVVMVVMDEFPLESLLDGTGAIDAELYPNFARLAAGSTWYRNDSTVAPFTRQAVPAILTGDYPPVPDGGIPIAATYPDNLFTLLGGTYDMNVHETTTRLCPSSLCGTTQLAGVESSRGVRSLVDEAWLQWKRFADPHRLPDLSGLLFGTASSPVALAKGEEFVDSLRPTDTPRLDFLHVLLPHEPWHYVQSGQDYGALTEGSQGLYGEKLEWTEDWPALVGRQRHLLQVQATDTLLGQILDKLERIGAYDRSLVVVTADHGVAFSKGEPLRGASPGNYPQIMWTPLFVKAPAQTEGVVDDRPARSIDVLPTIADHLRVDLPERVDGRSLLGTPRREGPVPLLASLYNTVQPPPGKQYISFDGLAGFTATIGASPVGSADSPPDLRLFRLGPYGDLVGRPLATVRDDTAAAFTGAVDDPGRLDAVDPAARDIPWVYLQGTTDTPDAGIPLAITINGTIAALAQTYPGPDGTTIWWAIAAPQAFRSGGNELRLSRIDGGPDAPRLSEVRLTNP